MPDKRDLEKRYANARSAARRGDEAVAQADKRASAAELKKLLHLSKDERFSSLVRTDLKLTQEDRQKLADSVREKETIGRPISSNTASLWAILRSRLRYKVALLGTLGTFALVGAGFYFVALRQTPELLVVSRYNQDIAASWRLSDGRPGDDRLVAGQKYNFFARDGDQGVLRMWVVGTGYAETRVPLNWLWQTK
jgi:hypothetical protein